MSEQCGQQAHNQADGTLGAVCVLSRALQDPRPHLSFAWALGDQASVLEPLAAGAGYGGPARKRDAHTATGAAPAAAAAAAAALVAAADLQVPVQQVICQIGQVKHVVWDAAGSGSATGGAPGSAL
jgi:hypothetical protein